MGSRPHPTISVASIKSRAAQNFLVRDIEGLTTQTAIKSAPTCAICLEEFSDPETAQPCRVKVCGHIFCATCLNAHVEENRSNSNKCPLCRAKLYKRDTSPKDDYDTSAFANMTLEDTLQEALETFADDGDLDDVEICITDLQDVLDSLHAPHHQPNDYVSDPDPAVDSLYRTLWRYMIAFEDLAAELTMLLGIDERTDNGTNASRSEASYNNEGVYRSVDVGDASRAPAQSQLVKFSHEITPVAAQSQQIAQGRRYIDIDGDVEMADVDW